MKTLNVSKLLLDSPVPDLDEISAKLDLLRDRHSVDELNWDDFSYKPGVKFAIAYSGTEIFLKFYVTEEHFKAEKTETNEMVCEDSCVEFFVSPAGDGIYYNIEFNAIGTCLCGSGTARENSSRISPEVISAIRRKGSLGSKPLEHREGNISWTMTIAIPAKVFIRHKIGNLEGMTMHANFYKCGDRLSLPHYLTWNPVGTSNPDFHQPRYFGRLNFV